MSEYHLLYWVFKILNMSQPEGLTTDDLLQQHKCELVGAPEWVWPALEEKIKQFNLMEKKK